MMKKEKVDFYYSIGMLFSITFIVLATIIMLFPGFCLSNKWIAATVFFGSIITLPLGGGFLIYSDYLYRKS